MIYNFGDGTTPKYDEYDVKLQKTVSHNIDEFKLVGAGLNKWFKGISRDSMLGWDEASFGASPTRSTKAPFSMTNIDNIEFGSVAQFEVTMPIVTFDDFLVLQEILHQRYFYVTFYNVHRGKWMTREMMVTNNERASLYNRGITVLGVQKVKVKFVATNRNLAEYADGITITYNYNIAGSTAKTVRLDVGEQYKVLGRNDVANGNKTLAYWATPNGGVVFPAQSITVFENLSLTAVWEDNI